MGDLNAEPPALTLARRDQRLIAHYIAKLGIVAIAVIEAPRSSRIRLAVDGDFGNAMRDGHARKWCKDAPTAISVIETFGVGRWRAAAGDGWFNLGVAEAMAALDGAAAIAGARLTDHHVVLERAARFVRDVDRVFADMQRRGEMRQVNAAYRAYRLAQTANQRPVRCYDDWRTDRLADVVAAVAARTLKCG